MKKTIIFMILGVFVLFSACGQSTFSITQATPEAVGTASQTISTETVTSTQTPVVSTSTVTPTQTPVLPTPTATPFRTAKGALVAEADLPVPEQGDWNEWDRVGNASVNTNIDGSIFYSQDDDLLIRAIFSDKLIVSSLDGSNKKILAEDGGEQLLAGPVLYHKGWIYYTIGNRPWKVRPDGSEKTQIANKHYSNMFIYDDLLYRLDDPVICMGLDGENEMTIDLPGEDIWSIFFEDGFVYYRSDDMANEGMVYRYNLTTGESIEFCYGDIYPTAIQNGWVYYGKNDSIYRTDGNKTEKLVTKKDIGKNGFTIYRNYLIFFDNQHMCFTMDLESLQVTQLFEIPGAANPSVMEDSIFCGVYYQITFTDDTAQLWELSWIKEEVRKDLPEEGISGE